MKKNILYFLALLFIFVSCNDSLCCDVDLSEKPKSLHISTIYFSPKTAKIGETINVTIVEEKKNFSKYVDYDKDFEITDDGKIKYIGKGTFYPLYNESCMVGVIASISSEKNNNIPHVEVTEYVSIEGFCYDSIDIISISFKVPADAKSGYVWVTDPGVAVSGFSDEKLIIVDENGNEITE